MKNRILYGEKQAKQAKQALERLEKASKQAKKALDLVLKSFESLKLNGKLHNLKNVGSKYHT